VADLLGAGRPEEVAFGANMTTLTFALSRALGATWKPGDEVVVTRLDHDANVSPWELAARDAGAAIRRVGFDPRDCTLDLDELRAQVNGRTRLVAVGAASNLVGTIHPIGEIAAIAHAAGAELFVDAVHLAPHRLIDVAAWGCDYLACSAYKFFGPHVGILWGRSERLSALPAYRLRAASPELPGRFMTGTPCLEGIAGALEAVAYLADLGREVAGPAPGRREALRAAFAAIEAWEGSLCRQLLAGLAALPGVRVVGLAEPERQAERTPTVAVLADGCSPQALSEELGRRGVFTWPGNSYALSLTEALALEPGGVLRVGLLHYNTPEEVARFLELLPECAARAKTVRLP
jgi:cysteine desulfurase family protein (TIGR01976 family)